MKIRPKESAFLRKLATTPGARILIEETAEATCEELPKFRGMFYFAPCPTCGHRVSERVSWRMIVRLQESGFLDGTPCGRDRVEYSLTEEGRAHLAVLAKPRTLADYGLAKP